MNPPTSLYHSGAAMNANAAQHPPSYGSGQLSTDVVQVHRSSLYSHSARLPALDSDGGLILQAPRRTPLRVLDLFSGIGGFSLGLERTGGFETVAFCEIEDFPRRVLAKHWPEVPCYHDVTKLTGDILARDGIAVDVITGGFPCQDISCAGKQRGIGEGTRSGLWSEIVRLIGELRPRYVIVENVAALLAGPSGKPGGWFGRILGDLAECGYDAEWENIPASALGAPHRRERIWITAYPAETRSPATAIFQGGIAKTLRGSWAPNTPERIIEIGRYPRVSIPAHLCLGDGVSKKLDDHQSGYGNAVVPQIPELIGRAILRELQS